MSERLLVPYDRFAFLEFCQPSLSFEELERERLEDSKRGVAVERGIDCDAEYANLAAEPLDVAVVVHLVRAATRVGGLRSHLVPLLRGARSARAQRQGVPVDSPFKRLLAVTGLFVVEVDGDRTAQIPNPLGQVLDRPEALRPPLDNHEQQRLVVVDEGHRSCRADVGERFTDAVCAPEMADLGEQGLTGLPGNLNVLAARGDGGAARAFRGVDGGDGT